jgi:hypothetical protein
MLQQTLHSKFPAGPDEYILALRPQKYVISYRLCGLVVRVSGYRSRGPGSIPGATIFSDK